MNKSNLTYSFHYTENCITFIIFINDFLMFLMF